jgi:hypothetical protein
MSRGNGDDGGLMEREQEFQRFVGIFRRADKGKIEPPGEQSRQQADGFFLGQLHGHVWPLDPEVMQERGDQARRRTIWTDAQARKAPVQVLGTNKLQGAFGVLVASIGGHAARGRLHLSYRGEEGKLVVGQWRGPVRNLIVSLGVRLRPRL